MYEGRTEENRESRTIRRKHSGILRRLLLVVVSLILGVNVYLWNARSLGRNSMPMPFGYGAAVVLSGSMEPTFSKDALVLVKKSEDISVGDIVVYQSGNRLIVHRVIGIDGDTIRAQGDANNVADPAFDISAVKGIVIGWIPYIGVLINMVKTPAGIILILVCAFLLVELSFRKQKDRDREELDAIKEEIRRLKEEKMSGESNLDERQQKGR